MKFRIALRDSLSRKRVYVERLVKERSKIVGFTTTHKKAKALILRLRKNLIDAIRVIKIALNPRGALFDAYWIELPSRLLPSCQLTALPSCQLPELALTLSGDLVTLRPGKLASLG